MINELIMWLIVFLLVWLLAILFLRHFVGSLILGFWSLILTPLCKISKVRSRLEALNRWLQVNAKTSKQPKKNDTKGG